MTTVQILITLLVISVALNAVAFWFIRNLLTKLFFVSNNLGEVNEVMLRFSEHLEAVHSMETFYGDQTLQGLLQHSELVVQMLSEFDDIYKVAEGYENLGAEADEEGEAVDGEEA
tara:strand:+ start:223 stop:567 length:345 start_codon:yes stop_codon:yes gene_type:complete